MEKPFFNANKMPDAKNEYVLWLDIMGTKSSMSNGVKASSIHICKLHVAILESKTEELHIYPVMDGAYITSASAEKMNIFIFSVFKKLKELFVDEEDRYKFMVKGALSYGPIIHGKDINGECSAIFADYPDYTEDIMFGLPMIQAAKNETLAAPFGIYCDESARQSSDIFCHRWHKWYLQGNLEDMTAFKSALQSYYNYVTKHSYEIDYEKSRIEEHREKCFQYFEIEG